MNTLKTIIIAALVTISVLVIADAILLCSLHISSGFTDAIVTVVTGV